MLTNLTVFVNEYKKLLGQEYEERAANIASGCAPSYDQYQRLVGVIMGLKLALDYVEEAKARADQMTTGN